MSVAHSKSRTPTASTGLLAVLGWPVLHSLSPVIHNAALRAQALDFVYTAHAVLPGDLRIAVAGMTALGYRGASITLPHKQAVMGMCDIVSEEARVTGAVNTLAWDEDRVLTGYNTDAVGLRRALESAGAPIGDAVVLGTGGAARAAVLALAWLGCDVTVIGRRMAAAEEIAEIATVGGMRGKAVDVGDDYKVARAARDARIVVNATPLGMNGESLPRPLMELGDGQLAYDMVYTPANTPFLEAATATGARTSHGLSMLVAQAAVAYELWTDVAPPMDVMLAAGSKALSST